MKCIVLFCALMLGLVISANAQAVEHPEKGSAERAAILDALRPVVERKLKQKIVFLIDTINLQGSWVFVDGHVRTPDGKMPDWKNTPYAEAAKNGMLDDGVWGLLKRSGSEWRVVTHAIGCADVCYVDWWRRFKAPKAIFPYTE